MKYLIRKRPHRMPRQTIRGKDKKGGSSLRQGGPPYSGRPTDLIMGRVDVAGIADPRTDSRAGTPRNGAGALKVDPPEPRIFVDGAEEAYDVLLVATGGKPEIPLPLSKEHPAIFPFDSLEDTLRIAERIPRSGTVAVYGPGFLAIVTSSALRKRGNEVVWFQPDIPRSGYPIAGELEANILDSVRNTGVRILDGQDIATVRDAGAEIEIESTQKGERILCLAVVVASERLPAIGFLSGSDVKIDAGIVVDDYLRTSVPNIYAAGDCAELFDKGTRTTRINFGWRSAIKQGGSRGEHGGGGSGTFREESDYLWACSAGSSGPHRVGSGVPGTGLRIPWPSGGGGNAGQTVSALCAFFVVVGLSFPASRGFATEDFARETGRACGECHLDASGGGDLNSAGTAFLSGRTGTGSTRPVSSPFHHGVRFAAGFLHLLTAVMWFGTILYVHLLLKPAYASRGLPRGELIVGWGSIVLIAVTGTILTFYRIPSRTLLHTRFRMLLTAKIAIFLVMTATAFVVTFAIGPRLRARCEAEPGKKT
jgi:uncharacterized membrane protein